jgi:hypothetical protein
MPDRASKPTTRYNSRAEDPNALSVHDNTNTAFVELSQMMNMILEHSCESLQGCATIHNTKVTAPVVSLSYETCCNMDLPTREESRTPFDGNSCCSPMQPTPSTHDMPLGSHPTPNGQWDSGRVDGCEGPLRIPPSPSTHMLPSGSSLMPNSEWGSGKEGGGGEGGEEMYPPPSPNSNEKDENNDENARAKNSSTCLLDTLPTHHGSVRPAPTKHPTNNWKYHSSNRGGAMTSQGTKPSLPKSSPLSFHTGSPMTKFALYSNVPKTYRGKCKPWQKPSRSTKSLESTCKTMIRWVESCQAPVPEIRHKNWSYKPQNDGTFVCDQLPYWSSTLMSAATLSFNEVEPHKGSLSTPNPSTKGKSNARELPTLHIHSTEMTRTPPMSKESEPLLSKSSPLPLHACLSMIKYALYSDVPNTYIRILESDALVTKANSIEIHAQPDEREPPTLKALPMCSDMPKLTNHSKAKDACLKRIVDMELPNSINISVTEIQAPSDNAKLTMIAHTNNQVWGSGATPMTYGRSIKQVDSHKEQTLEFNVKPNLDHKSNWPQHQGLNTLIHWERCRCYRCILIKTPLKIPPQYEPNSGTPFVVPLDEVRCKLDGYTLHHAYQVQNMRFTLPQCAPKRHLNNMRLCRSGYTADKVPHPLKGHKPFKLLNCFIHYLVNLEIRMLCTLYTKFWGRRQTELVKRKIWIILSRVTSLVYQMCLHAILTHLMPSSTPCTSQLHGLVKTFVNSAVNNKFTGIAINIEMLQVVDRNCWAMERPKQSSVNHVNLVMCDSTPTTTTMLPKKQPHHDQP